MCGVHHAGGPAKLCGGTNRRRVGFSIACGSSFFCDTAFVPPTLDCCAWPGVCLDQACTNSSDLRYLRCKMLAAFRHRQNEHGMLRRVISCGSGVETHALAVACIHPCGSSMAARLTDVHHGLHRTHMYIITILGNVAIYYSCRTSSKYHPIEDVVMSRAHTSCKV